ncbi:hypothetical protein PLICRDRAFT_37584 [Plicaturopsis crispa FD-325 SS-3]|nr:hypothetical protein PLICRDRAFT_37584 [Plicaturopsis crispa FD-325 SS-3]
MVGLPTSEGPTKTLRRHLRRVSKQIMKSHPVRIPRYDLPVRIRPAFMVFTAVIMLILAFLGFSRREFPVNDKLLHFFCLAIATGVFYFIFDVDEDARRVWFWRHAGLIFTAVVCFFFGGLVSEFVQSLLPYKEFQFGDVVANLMGSAIGLYISYHLEKYYRHRREISRLYRPITADPDSDSEEDAATQLLPTHRELPQPSKHKKTPSGGALDDVWDEREELFAVGDEDDEEEGDRGDEGDRGRGRGHGLS